MKFAAEREMEGKTFTGRELMKHLGGKGWSEVKGYSVRTWGPGQILDGVFEGSGGEALLGTGDDGSEADIDYRIMYPAMMHYLEWIELQEARRSSRRAMKFAIVSIGIAALAFFLNVIVSFTTVTVQLEENQLEKLTRAIRARSNEQ